MELKLITPGFDKEQMGTISADIERLKKHVDVFVVDADHKPKKLVAFDMDSTLIQHEVIVELAKEAGCSTVVSEITESAMRGEITFKESFRQRMKLLKGLDVSVLESINAQLKMSDGADVLLRLLKDRGIIVAIISGGFDFFANRIKDKYGLDYVFANKLPIENGLVTGLADDYIVGSQEKAAILRQLMDDHNLEPSEVIAVGDGANDLLMLKEAGIGVAFRAKPVVREQCDVQINHSGLDAIRHLL